MHCRLCGTPDLPLKYIIQGFDQPFSIYQCPRCGFEQQDIDPARAGEFYDQAYYQGSAAYSYTDERQQEQASRLVWQARVARLRRMDHSRASQKVWLDVGCAFGGLMQTAREAGYGPYGVEISDYSGDYAARRFGPDRLYIGSIEEIRLPADLFSVVTMIEVIEHLYDPRRALQNIYSSMKKGGVLLVQTANMAGLQARLAGRRYHYYLPGHLSYFNRYNLADSLRQAGFRRVRFVGGVEFGLGPKLAKTRLLQGGRIGLKTWLRISLYHLLSRIPLGRQRLTSSMVMLAWK